MRFIFLIYLTIIVILSSCHKPCNQPNYSLAVTAFFSPEKDSVSVGDTLWLSCVIPKNMTDINSQSKINFSNAENLGGNLFVSDISAFTDQRWAVDSFLYFSAIGQIYSDSKLNPRGVKQLSYHESDTAYPLRAGLIAAKRGTYILTVSDVPGVYRKGSPNCGIGNFQILNANVNKHLYLFENLWGAILSPYDKASSYCFKVK